jgi:hypothetical protein
MIQRPNGIGVFEFAVLAGLRASQLVRGCAPRIDGTHTVAMTAQLEVAGGMVVPVSAASDATVVSEEIVVVDSPLT